MLRWYTGTLVGHSDKRAIGCRGDMNTDDRFMRAVLDRVIDHVRDRFSEDQRIRIDDDAAREIELQLLMALLRENGERGCGVANELPQVHRLSPQRDSTGV